MKYNEILELTRAGFNSQQIVEMMKEERQHQQEPAGQQPAAANPDPAQDPVSPASQGSIVSDLKNEIAELKAMIINQNINNSNNSPDPQPSSDDVLSAIIRADIPIKKEAK